MKTLVIAECGSSHDNDVANFRRLIEAAHVAGADMVKFQWTSDPRKMAERRHAPELKDAYAKYLTWPKEWHDGLWRACHDHGMLYGCTVFLPEDVAVVAPHVDHFKVASFEANAYDLLEAHVPFLKGDTEVDRDRWLIISRGMGANDFTHLPYAMLHKVKLLLCTSAYPAPVEGLNLRRFHLSSAFDEDVLDGFSDHSDPGATWTGALAVAAGAEIVERHLRLSDTAPENPDFPHSMPPRAFADYVRHLRYAEAALGDGLARAQPCEAPMLPYRVTV